MFTKTYSEMRLRSCYTLSLQHQYPQMSATFLKKGNTPKKILTLLCEILIVLLLTL